MKKLIVCGVFLIGCISFITVTSNDDPVPIPRSQQRFGNADSGYQYIISGDYVKSGLPLNLYQFIFKKEKNNLLDRAGDNSQVRYDFNVVKAVNGESVVVPNCFQCHAQFFDGKLIIGLGNSTGDFTREQKLKPFQKMLLSYLKLKPKKYEAAKDFLTVSLDIGDELFTDIVGANPADRLTALLVSHRDPVTLEWNRKPSVILPEQVIPSDVPAWWLLKKKNAMFYNGFGRGDFGRFLMGSSLLTTKDTVHAKEVDTHMPDVLSYLYTIEAPKYPKGIDEQLAGEGKTIFENNCSRCHGTYGANGQYPNLLIPESIIGTDSLLNKSNYQYSDLIDWYNKSWFSKGDHPATLAPFNGYIAPPLDGVWITAPYFHNGSVPTIEAVLNSKLRPRYWARDFVQGTSSGDSSKYDYEKLGWQYQSLPAPGNKYVYNTMLPGYGNYGHSFGDHLTDAERKAVIEYLKTL
ncbi:MAG: c-type cytochrome [Bacteroidetes bacterium]|nr:MAG: c-type cytochrome [Bacteroidota bacterium]